MTWDNVELIRNAQTSAKERFAATSLATHDEIQKAVNTEVAKGILAPRISEVEQMIFKIRSEMIDYIVAHGLVDGLILDGVLQPVENGKIVITSELIRTITKKLGYFDEGDVRRFIEKYLPEHSYVADEGYTHTDNNYTTPEKNKLAGVADGAEVNKVIDVIFNGVSVLDDGTRVATITITPEDVKRWYESNPDTNTFTDAQKAKLAGISDGAEVNRVDDVLIDGRSVLADDKKAKITPEDIKKAYEKNPDTNAFTDAEKTKLAGIASGATVSKVDNVTLDGTTVVDAATKTAKLTAAAIKKSYESNADTNAFTDAEKTKLAGIASGATVSKVDNVTLDGTTVVDAATKTAKLTAAAIKKSYESNADTNAFTDAEKTKLAALPIITLSGPSHNAYYRGENLGTTVTAEQLNAIKSGSFADLFIGDYWVLNGVKWTIAQFDRYYVNYANYNNPAARKHHVTVVNETPIGTIEFNTNDWSTGGFVSSNVRTAAIESVTPIVTAAFGDNITPVGLYEWTGLNASGTLTGEWKTETIIVPSSAQVAGVETVGLEDTTGGYTFDDTGRMPLFQYAPYARFLTDDSGASVVYPLRSARVSRSGDASTLQGLAIGAWGDIFTPTPSFTQAGQFRVMVNIAKED